MYSQVKVKCDFIQSFQSVFKVSFEGTKINNHVGFRVSVVAKLRCSTMFEIPTSAIYFFCILSIILLESTRLVDFRLNSHYWPSKEEISGRNCGSCPMPVPFGIDLTAFFPSSCEAELIALI